jgi:hypothetical protein
MHIRQKLEEVSNTVQIIISLVVKEIANVVCVLRLPGKGMFRILLIFQGCSWWKYINDDHILHVAAKSTEVLDHCVLE